MKSLLALALVSLFAFSVASTVAVAACGAKHCVAGDTECEKKKKDKTTGAQLFLTNDFACWLETQPPLEVLQSGLKSGMVSDFVKSDSHATFLFGTKMAQKPFEIRYSQPKNPRVLRLKLVSPARVMFPSRTPMTHQYPIESTPQESLIPL